MADERKRRRMESNRESARRSRVKKQQQLQQVISDIDLIKRQNAQTASKIEETRQRYSEIEAEINTVTAQKTDLERRLGQLNSTIDKIELARRAAVLSPPLTTRVDSWSDFSKHRAEMVVNCDGYWMEGNLGTNDFDLSLSPCPWRLMASASASAVTLSRN